MIMMNLQYLFFALLLVTIGSASPLSFRPPSITTSIARTQATQTITRSAAIPSESDSFASQFRKPADNSTKLDLDWLFKGNVEFRQQKNEIDLMLADGKFFSENDSNHPMKLTYLSS
jgi:hypothetical protein